MLFASRQDLIVYAAVSYLSSGLKLRHVLGSERGSFVCRVFATFFFPSVSLSLWFCCSLALWLCVCVCVCVYVCACVVSLQQGGP